VLNQTYQDAVFVQTGAMDLQTTIKAAEGTLKQTFGIPISLDLAEVMYDYAGSPSTVLRCKRVTPTDFIPETVIVKRSNIGNNNLLCEAAGLEFLNEVMPGIAPHLYGIDPQAHLIIVEDLCCSPDDLLGNILFNRDADVAEAALTEFQHTLARMHLATMGHEDRFHTIQARYQPTTQPSRHRIHHILDALHELPVLWDLIGVSMMSDVQEDIEEVMRIIQTPEMFKTLVHGDATPANAFYSKGNIRLFDLESANFGHCLLDGTYGHIRYIHSVWARSIPLDVQHRITAVYRQMFLENCQVDETTFNRHFVGCSAGWLAGLCMLLPPVIEKDHKWGRTTNRQRVVAALAHFTIISEEFNLFRSLGRTCQTAEKRLRGIWAELDCTMPMYPSFEPRS
jgi:hypothetical protein